MSVVGLLGIAWGVTLALPLVHRAGAAAARARADAIAGGGVPSAVRDRLGAWRRTASSRTPGPVLRVLADGWRRIRRRDRSRAVERGVPLALDVITMAARAGYTPRLALAAGAQWSPADVGRALRLVEQRVALGATFVDALADLGRDEPALRSLTDALVVAERSGAPVADLLARVADDARTALRRRAEAHARRVPVRLLFPLVFLVLPAFGLLTVVPALAAGLRHT